MSESNVSNDRVERKASELDNKIEMEKVRNDAKFERLITQSDLKFEKLIGDMKQPESAHTKWMVGIAFSLISFTIAAISVSTSILLKAIPSSPTSQQSANPGSSEEPPKQQPSQKQAVQPTKNKK